MPVPQWQRAKIIKRQSGQILITKKYLIEIQIYKTPLEIHFLQYLLSKF